MFAVAVLASSSAYADLVGYWSFDDNGAAPNPNQLTDSSGNNLHGTLVNSPSWVPGHTGGAGDYALSFSGSNRVDLSNPPELAIAGDQTIVMWIYPTDMTERRGVFGKEYGGSAAITVFGDSERAPDGDGIANLIYLYGNTGVNGGSPSNPREYQAFSAPLSKDQWSFIAITRDLETTASDGRLTFYVNDSKFTSTPYFTSPDGANPVVAGNLPAYLGLAYNGYWIGLIDDSAIWDQALDTARVRSIYTVPTELGLSYELGDVMALWDIYDSGGDGTVKGIPWQFTTSLPDLPTGGPPALGDAYVNGGVMYLALGNGTGLAAVPEPSTFLLSAIGLLALVFVSLRRQKRAA